VNILTVDKREISEQEVRDLFDTVYNQHVARDSEWSWKGSLCYEVAYESVVQINNIITAMIFFVGGPCNVTMYTESGVPSVCITNAGYYANIGA